MTDPADGANAFKSGAPRAGDMDRNSAGGNGRTEAGPGNKPRNTQAFKQSGSHREAGDSRPESSRPAPEAAESRENFAHGPDRTGPESDRPGYDKTGPDKKRRRRRSRRRKSKNANGAGTGGVAANQEPDLSHKMRGQPKGHPDNPAPDVKAERPAPKRDQNTKPRQWRRDRGNTPLYAALDLGTNNCRLLVALPTKPGQFRVVDAFSRIVRLGEGLGATGQLSQAAMDRAVEALKVCASKLENRPVRRHRLIATEACRAAGNGVEFLQRVTAETGLELEIVNRETEARLAVSGCSSLVGRETEGVVLFDIGGGSSEIAAIDLSGSRSNRLANHIKAWTSLPVGVVTLSERHGGQHVTSEIYGNMVSEVADLLADFVCPEIPGCQGASDGMFHLLGTSGTVTTLAGVHLDLPRYDRRRVDGLWLTSQQVDLMTQKLLSWDFHERSSNPCIGADRADLVLAGCAILDAIRLRWPSERLRVADRGLREGLLTEMMAADGIWRRGRGKRNFYNRQNAQSGNRPGSNSATKGAGR